MKRAAFEEDTSKKCEVYVMLAREAYRAALVRTVEVMNLLGMAYLEAMLVSGRLGYVGLFQFYHIRSIQQQCYRNFPGLGKIHCKWICSTIFSWLLFDSKMFFDFSILQIGGRFIQFDFFSLGLKEPPTIWTPTSSTWGYVGH